MANLFANSGDPDQMPHSAASDLGLHCLPVALLQTTMGYDLLIFQVSFNPSNLQAKFVADIILI